VTTAALRYLVLHGFHTFPLTAVIFLYVRVFFKANRFEILQAFLSSALTVVRNKLERFYLKSLAFEGKAETYSVCHSISCLLTLSANIRQA
jgi:hypothetical protein